MQRKSAAQDKLCEDYKAGRVRISPVKVGGIRSKVVHDPVVAVPDRGLQEREAPSGDSREEHPMRINTGIRLHEGPMPIQKPPQPVNTDGGGRTKDEAGEKQRVEEHRGGPIRDTPGGPRSRERGFLPVPSMRFPSGECVRGARTRETRPRHDGVGTGHVVLQQNVRAPASPLPRETVR